mgnify:CR=1 FL=1
MLLQEQMKQDIFSYNERIIVDFILEKQEKIKEIKKIKISFYSCTFYGNFIWNMI